jgi:glycerol uptake facilitator-like aquaporin
MHQYLVEFIGTAVFMYVVLETGNPLAIGAVFALLLLITTNISKGFFNPAIAIAMASAGKMDTAELGPYIASQCFGALVALEIYKRFQL